MKNQFDFFGIKTPERRKILAEHRKQGIIVSSDDLKAIVKELWLEPQRELQYCAIDLLMHYRKIWEREFLELVEFCITSKSWWDTVDPLSYDCAGIYFRMFPEEMNRMTEIWNGSENFWFQRSSLLFQKNYKRNTDTQLLSRYIVHLSSSPQFFVQKAIGWILREYAKTDPAWVKKFVGTHPLAPLSQKEALKHL